MATLALALTARVRQRHAHTSQWPNSPIAFPEWTSPGTPRTVPSEADGHAKTHDSIVETIDVYEASLGRAALPNVAFHSELLPSRAPSGAQLDGATLAASAARPLTPQNTTGTRTHINLDTIRQERTCRQRTRITRDRGIPRCAIRTPSCHLRASQLIPRPQASHFSVGRKS